MSEYIFDVPDSNQPIAGDSAVYYPDERDDPMIVREEIVRCRDCKHYDEYIHSCDWWSAYERLAEPDGFCAWAERTDNFATCKCGEDIETNGRESVTCPSCGRVITE